MEVTEKARRSARLNMRLTPDELLAIREAAQREGKDVTTFVLSAALDRVRASSHGDRRASLSPQ